MPAFTYLLEGIRNLSGVTLGDKELLDTIAMLGADVGKMDGKSMVEIKFFTNRPDLFNIKKLSKTIKTYIKKPKL